METIKYGTIKLCYAVALNNTALGIFYIIMTVMIHKECYSVIQLPDWGFGHDHHNLHGHNPLC